jgi:hypothetical protein
MTECVNGAEINLIKTFEYEGGKIIPGEGFESFSFKQQGTSSSVGGPRTWDVSRSRTSSEAQRSREFS